MFSSSSNMSKLLAKKIGNLGGKLACASPAKEAKGRIYTSVCLCFITHD